jgi:hypothetical protein
MEEDRIEPDEAFAKNLMQDALDLWINPEIERRRESGTLPDDFAVRRAQVIMNIDAHAPEVRFNEEIKALARARAARAIDAGEEVTEVDLEGIEDIVLTDQDPNAGHLTMMLFKGHWIIAFDFRYNAGRVACTVGAAREFLDSAAPALERFANRVASCEDAAHGHLLEGSQDEGGRGGRAGHPQKGRRRDLLRLAEDAQTLA